MRSKYERLAQKELEQQGYKVDYKARPHFTPRGYNTDYLGCFDLIAQRNTLEWVDVGEEHVFAHLRFIAIKGHQGVPSSLRQAIEALQFPEGVLKEIWVFRADKTVKKEIIP